MSVYLQEPGADGHLPGPCVGADVDPRSGHHFWCRQICTVPVCSFLLYAGKFKGLF